MGGGALDNAKFSPAFGGGTIFSHLSEMTSKTGTCASVRPFTIFQNLSPPRPFDLEPPNFTHMFYVIFFKKLSDRFLIFHLEAEID